MAAPGDGPVRGHDRPHLDRTVRLHGRTGHRAGAPGGRRGVVEPARARPSPLRRGGGCHAFGALAVPWLLDWGHRVLLGATAHSGWDSAAYHAGAGLFVAIALLPFCACMGATFPLAISVLNRSPGIARAPSATSTWPTWSGRPRVPPLGLRAHRVAGVSRHLVLRRLPRRIAGRAGPRPQPGGAAVRVEGGCARRRGADATRGPRPRPCSPCSSPA
jgi:hypothetical protein